MDWLPDENEYDIRYSNEGDLPHLQKWLQDPQISRWYPISTENDLDSMTKNWIGFSKYGASLTAAYKNEPVAIATLFLMPYRKLIHHCLLYFIVNPDYKGRGVGTSILRNITHLAKGYFRLESMHIELFEECPALSIIQKSGFHEVFSQDRFVKEGDGKYLSRSVYEIDLKNLKDQSGK